MTETQLQSYLSSWRLNKDIYRLRLSCLIPSPFSKALSLFPSLSHFPKEVTERDTQPRSSRAGAWPKGAGPPRSVPPRCPPIRPRPRATGTPEESGTPPGRACRSRGAMAQPGRRNGPQTARDAPGTATASGGTRARTTRGPTRLGPTAGRSGPVSRQQVNTEDHAP